MDVCPVAPLHGEFQAMNTHFGLREDQPNGFMLSGKKFIGSKFDRKLIYFFAKWCLEIIFNVWKNA